jgi:hypothetical protein
MKKSIILMLLIIWIFNLQAANKPTDTFIIIGDETYYCDKVHVGKANTRIYRDGKEILKVRTSLVSAYAHEGKFHEYLPVLNKNQDTTGWAFMQFITSHEGNRLYRFCSNCIQYDPVSGIIAPVVPVYRYYIFKSGRFVSVTDDQDDLHAQLSSFNVKVLA